MKFNASSVLLAPGMALVGLAAGGWKGLGWGIGLWCALVVIGTVVFIAHRSLGRGHGVNLDDAAIRPIRLAGTSKPKRP